jgi:hypothetical protein
VEHGRVSIVAPAAWLSPRGGNQQCLWWKRQKRVTHNTVPPPWQHRTTALDDERADLVCVDKPNTDIRVIRVAAAIASGVALRLSRSGASLSDVGNPASSKVDVCLR